MTIITPKYYEAAADEEDKGLRLDKFLSNKLPDISRSRLKSLIVEGQVFLKDSEKKYEDPSAKIKGHEIFGLNIPDLVEPIPEGEDIPLDIYYEDDHLNSPI